MCHTFVHTLSVCVCVCPAGLLARVRVESSGDAYSEDIDVSSRASDNPSPSVGLELAGRLQQPSINKSGSQRSRASFSEDDVRVWVNERELPV